MECESFTAISLYSTSKEWLSAQTNVLMPLENLNAQLLILQTAFPLSVRNYDEYEFKALQSLWYEIFKNVPEELMNEAVKRFIITERKGFFPSPGQIVGCIEDIMRNREAEKLERLLAGRLTKEAE